MSNRDESYAVDILEAAKLVRQFIEDVDRETFDQDMMRQSAVIRQFEIMGEAAKRLSAEFRDTHPGIPWRQMAGMRDILIHAYNHVDMDTVWNAAASIVPDLVQQLEPLIPREEEEEITGPCCTNER
jgi:uncharacterized protein with HEPN domain